MSSADPKPVKLPYFHRTLSPQDAALIGDTTPKPISSTSNNDNTINPNIREASAWNAAQTWEERDCTAWGKSKIRELLTASVSSDGLVTLSEPSKVEGNASITHVRGRARFMYEWSFSIDVELRNNDINSDNHSGNDGANNVISASVDVSEAINDQLDDIIVTPVWKNKALPRDVQKAALSKMQKAIVEKVREFEAQFKEYRP